MIGQSSKDATKKSKRAERTEAEQVEEELEELYLLGLQRSEKKEAASEDFDLELLEMFTGYKEGKHLQNLLKSKPKVTRYSQQGFEFFTIEQIGEPIYWVFYARSFCSCKSSQKCAHIYYLDISHQRRLPILGGTMDASTFAVGLFNALN